jgi:hypothetical protein
MPLASIELKLAEAGGLLCDGFRWLPNRLPKFIDYKPVSSLL